MTLGTLDELLGAGAEERVRPGCAKESGLDSEPQMLPIMAWWYGRDEGEERREKAGGGMVTE